MWWVTQIIGCVFVTIINYVYRIHGASTISIVGTTPLWMLVGVFFSMSYNKAPTFMQAWFLGAIVLAAFGLLTSLVLLKESAGAYNVIGMALAIIASLLLAVK